MLLLCAAGASQAAEPAGRPALPPDFDATVARVMKDWSVPGVAIAVVRAGGDTVLKSYGKRQWDRDLPITADSMFGIASITKTYVAAGVALLVQDGKLSWDDPVVKHLPEFRVKDPWVTREVTIRDLVSHRSGIASHGDFLEELPDLDVDDAVRMLANYGQSTPFRAGAEYSSYTFMVLDRIITKVSGMPWSQFLRERLFLPLGLQHTYARTDEFVPRENILPTGDGWLDSMPTGLDAVGPQVDVAAPHVQWEAFFGGKAFYDRRELSNRAVHFHHTAIDSGQGTFSSIRDMAAWARVLLERGDGRVLKQETVRDMMQLTSLEARDWPLGTAAESPVRVRSVGFGLGFIIYERGGRPLFGHSGSELGYLNWMIVDPHAGFALVVLTNNFGFTRGAMPALVETLLDWHHGLPAQDWSARYIEAGRESFAQNKAAIEGAYASLPPYARPPKLATLVGRYENPIAGPLSVELRKGTLVATTGRSYDIELQHATGGIFRGTVVSPMRIPMLVRFDIDGGGVVAGLSLERAGEPDERFSYSRREAH